MPLLLWTASFAPVSEIRINHWFFLTIWRDEVIHLVFVLLHRTVCFPWSEDSSCTGCTIPLKWNQSFERLMCHSSKVYWRFMKILYILTLFLAEGGLLLFKTIGCCFFLVSNSGLTSLEVSVFFSSAQCINWCTACGDVAGFVAQGCWDVAGTTEVLGVA